jgi:hypothetical protein
MSVLLISSPLARLVRAWRRDPDRTAVFELVDGALLDANAFHASDSMGLDGAPSMAFVGTMPAYSCAIDRPSSRPSDQ